MRHCRQLIRVKRRLDLDRFPASLAWVRERASGLRTLTRLDPTETKTMTWLWQKLTLNSRCQSLAIFCCYWYCKLPFERLLRDFWETFERLLKDFWKTFERLLRDFWKTFERFLGDFWETFERLLSDFWATFERLLKDFWKTFERLFGDVWETFERLLSDFWETFQSNLAFPPSPSQASPLSLGTAMSTV